MSWPPYQSAYTGAIARRNGEFDFFVREVNDNHLQDGHWRFHFPCHERAAYKHGLHSPEEVLQAAANGEEGLGDLSDVLLSWWPGWRDSNLQGQVTGTAEEHLSRIYNVRKYLGLPINFLEEVPVYPIDSRLQSYWQHLGTSAPSSSWRANHIPRSVQPVPTQAVAPQHQHNPEPQPHRESPDSSTSHANSAPPPSDTLIHFLVYVGPSPASAHSNANNIVVQDSQDDTIGDTLRDTTNDNQSNASQPNRSEGRGPRSIEDTTSQEDQVWLDHPRCQRCVKSRRKCNRQRPCWNCHSLDQCVPEEVSKKFLKTQKFLQSLDKRKRALLKDELSPHESIMRFDGESDKSVDTQCGPGRVAAYPQPSHFQGPSQPEMSASPAAVQLASHGIPQKPTLESYYDTTTRNETDVHGDVLVSEDKASPEPKSPSLPSLKTSFGLPRDSGLASSLIVLPAGYIGQPQSFHVDEPPRVVVAHSDLSSDTGPHSVANAEDTQIARSPPIAQNGELDLPVAGVTLDSTIEDDGVMNLQDDTPSQISYPICESQESNSREASDRDPHDILNSHTFLTEKEKESTQAGERSINETAPPASVHTTQDGTTDALEDALMQQDSLEEEEVEDAFELPCMDCGQVSEHRWDCHIGNIKPRENLTSVDYRELAEMTERFDPNRAIRMYDPVQMVVEDPQDQIRGMAEVVRNEESYRNDPLLHALPEELMLFVWGLRSCMVTQDTDHDGALEG